MAKLIRCSSCRKRISRDAASCPKCGHPAELQPVPTRRRSAIRTLAVAVGGAFLLFGVALPEHRILNQMEAHPGQASWSDDREQAAPPVQEPSPHPKPAKVERKPSSLDRGEAWVYVQEFVKQRLKAPSTAAFPWFGAKDVESLGGDRFAVRSYVDSQNGFGAKVRQRFRAVVRKAAGSWHLEELRFED